MALPSVWFCFIWVLQLCKDYPFIVTAIFGRFYGAALMKVMFFFSVLQ